MRCRLFAVVGIGLFTWAIAAGDDAKTDLDQFQGTWVSVEYVVDGKPWGEKERRTLKLTVKGNRSTFTVGDTSRHGDYQLNPGKSPKELDILLTDGPDRGKVKPAIYEFEGDRLRICLSATGAKERPKEFASKPRQGVTLEVWKRSAP